MRFNEKIRVSLKNNEWTQAEFANLIHVAPTTVQKWAVGRNTPNIEIIKEIGRVLNIPIQELLDDSVDIVEFYVVDKYLPYEQDMYPEVLRDSEHIIIDAGLKGESFLHRFENAENVAFSAIYYAKREIWSTVRERERFMIRAWNEWGYNHFV